MRGDRGDTDRRGGKQEPEDQAVQEHERQIVRPADRRGYRCGAPGRQPLAGRDAGEDAEEESQPNRDLLRDDPVVPVHAMPFRRPACFERPREHSR